MTPAITSNVLETRTGRLLTFGTLYISEGIPLGFTAVAMAAYMRRAGLDVSQVTAFVAILYLPWAFKWAWAPLIDLVPLARFGGRRAWIVVCLLAMIVTLVAAGLLDFVNQFELLLAVILVHNVFSATQDIAIDSLAVTTLKDDERGKGNGFMFGGAYIGQGLGGGGAMFVAGFWGFEAALIYACALLTGIALFAFLWVRDPLVTQIAASGRDTLAQFWGTLSQFVKELFQGFFRSGRGPIFGVVFALTPLGAMALGGAIGTTVAVDYGLSDGQIAEITVYSTVLSGIGCVIGGVLGDRFGLRKMIATFYFLTTLPTLYLATLVDGGASLQSLPLTVIYGSMMVLSLFTGLHYGTTAAIYMGLTNPLVAATQFTGFMALSNLTIAYTNYWQGRVFEAFDLATVLYIDAALVIVPLMVLPFMKPREGRSTAKPPAVAAPLPEAST